MTDISPAKSAQRIINWALLSFAVLIAANALAVHYTGFVLLPLVKALGLGIICIIYGAAVQRLFKQEKISLETSFGFGLIVTTFYFFILAFLQQLTLFWFYVYIGSAVPAGIYLFLEKASHLGNETPGSGDTTHPTSKLTKVFAGEFSTNQGGKLGQTHCVSRFGAVFSKSAPCLPEAWYLLFLFPLFYAALPSSFFDTLVYHLGIPNMYIQQGGFFPTPQFLYANTSIYYEISMIPAVFAGDLVPRFFHLFVGMGLVAAVVNFAGKYFRVRRRWLLVLLILTMPMSGFLLTTVKNDLAGALFILLAIKFLMQKKFPTAGLFSGFAIGIKYFNALPVMIFLVLFFLFYRKIPIKQYIYFFLLFFAALLPLFAKNFFYCGNPAFPFLHSLFPSTSWDESRFRMMARDVGRVCRSWKDFIYLPYNLSFKELGSGGRVGVQFLAFLPLILVGRAAAPPNKGEKKDSAAHPEDNNKIKNLLLLFSLTTIAAGCWFTGSIRFFYAAFLMLCILVVWIYEKREGKLLKVLMLFILVLNMVYSVTLLNYLYTPGFLYKEDYKPDQYKTLNFPAYPAFKFINQRTAPGSKILLVGETKNYYLKRPYIMASAIDYSILKSYLEKADTPSEFLSLLRSDGIDYLLINLPEFQRLQEQYDRLTGNQQKKALSFFKQLKSVFQAKGVYVAPI